MVKDDDARVAIERALERFIYFTMLISRGMVLETRRMTCIHKNMHDGSERRAETNIDCASRYEHRGWRIEVISLMSEGSIMVRLYYAGVYWNYLVRRPLYFLVQLALFIHSKTLYYRILQCLYLNCFPNELQ